MNCGELLVKLRKERKLTQAQVAKALGIPKSTLSEYERNNVTPSLSRFFQIVTFYGLDALFALYGLQIVNISNYSEIGKQKLYAIDQEERKKADRIVL